MQPMKEKIQNIFKKYKKEILIFSLPFLALVNLIFTYQTGESLLNKLEAIPNYYLSSDLTSAGQAAGTLFTAISSTGFSVGASNLVNQNTNSFVAWNWKEDPASGFDMLTYTGTGVAHTIAHNLSATPAFIMIKRTDVASAWTAYHQSLTTPSTQYLALNTTAAQATDATMWNSTTPTSAVFSLGTNAAVNTNAGTYIAYAFAEKAGYSKFGSYTGNGSADGPFVYTGFKPKYVMVKTNSTTGDWYIWDTARDTYNPLASNLLGNTSAAQTSSTAIDSNANGFKIRNSTAGFNTNAASYVYAAFADYPFERATTNQGYTIASSTRFNGTNANLTRTYTSNATWTFSAWVKRSGLGTLQNIFGSTVRFNSDDTLTAGTLTTTAVFRDPSAWYHIVVSNTGVKVNNTSYGTITTTAQTNTSISTANFFTGYLSDVIFIDGQNLTSTDFGQFDTNANWGPKNYTGTYGTNGFKLAFGTPASPGTDTSGNGNNFTNNNIATTDNVLDTPTNNFATHSPLDRSPTTGSLSQGNLTWSYGSNSIYPGARSTIGMSTGKWYWETMIDTMGSASGAQVYIGVSNKGFNFNDSTNITFTGLNSFYYMGNGNKSTGNGGGQTVAAYGAAYSTGDVISTGLDMDAGTITFYKNGVSQGVAYTGLTGIYFSTNTLLFNASFTSNFGQGGQSGLTYDSASGGYFKYTPPTGFKALSSANMITAGVSSIAKPSDYFNAITYTGNGTAQTFTSLLFEPAFVWVKNRTSATSHALFGDGSITSPITSFFQWFEF